MRATLRGLLEALKAQLGRNHRGYVVTAYTAAREPYKRYTSTFEVKRYVKRLKR